MPKAEGAMYGSSNLLHELRTKLLEPVTVPNITLPVMLRVEALSDTHVHVTEHKST